MGTLPVTLPIMWAHQPMMWFDEPHRYYDAGPNKVRNGVGRETGMDLELDDVPVHSLVPEPLRGLASPDDFLARLPEFDGDLAQQLADAEAAGECLRFVGAPRCPMSRAVDLVHLSRSVARGAWEAAQERAVLLSCSGRWQARCVCRENGAVTACQRRTAGADACQVQSAGLRGVRFRGSGAAQAWWTARRARAAWSCGATPRRTPSRSCRAPTTSSPSPRSATRTSRSSSGAPLLHGPLPLLRVPSGAAAV